MPETSDILKKKIGISKDNILSFILFSFFISESLTTILEYLQFEYYRIGAAVKIIFIVFYFYVRGMNKFLLKFLSILIVLFIISQLFLNHAYSLLFRIESSLIFIVKYFFIFFIIDFIEFSQIGLNDVKKAIKTMFFLLKINFIIIIIGIVFNINLFTTYSVGRFGYSGLIQMNSHASYIYIFASILVFYNFFEHKKINENTIIIIISSLLIGTKTIYIFYMLLFLYIIFSQKLYMKKLFLLFISLLIFTIVIFKSYIYGFLSRYFFIPYIVYKRHGFFTAISSRRNEHLEELFKCGINLYWDFFNYIFGGAFFYEIRSEMAFIDLLIFWGPIGCLIYMYIYYKYILKVYTINIFLKYSFIFVFIVAFFGGNFFTNAVTAIYIAIITKYFYHIQRPKSV